MLKGEKGPRSMNAILEEHRERIEGDNRLLSENIVNLEYLH